MHGSTLLKGDGCKTLCPTDCQGMEWNVRRGVEGLRRGNGTWYNSILNIECIGKLLLIIP